MNVYNDDEVLESLKAEYTTYTDDGKPKEAKPKRIFRFFRSLKNEGFEQVKQTTPEKTFYRNMKELTQVVPKAYLQNLHSTKSNIIPLVRLVNVDFSNQHPQGWQEPVTGNLMNIENGQYIAGEFLGVKTLDKANADRSKTWQEIYFGISIPVSNGYNGQSATIDIRLSKDAIEMGEHNKVDNLVGNFVLVPVNVMARAYQDKAYMTNFFDNRRRIIQPNEAKLQKVS